MPTASKISPQKKIRADILLVQQHLAPTRTRAISLIMSGVVFCGTQKIEKPSQLFSPEIELTLKGKDHPYVGRGGVKLKAALDAFHIDVRGKNCLDVGASTGGFTDCLLKEGAKKVTAVDVGYGQLDWALRNDPRVVVIERTNFRNFDPSDLSDGSDASDRSDIDLITIDVSFISLTKIIPKAVEIFRVQNPPQPPFVKGGGVDSPPLEKGGQGGFKTLIALIKPQFEVGKQFVGKGGIVKDREKQKECVEKIKIFCENQRLKISGIIPSPILGQDGNQEFLLVAVLI